MVFVVEHKYLARAGLPHIQARFDIARDAPAAEVEASPQSPSRVQACHVSTYQHCAKGKVCEMVHSRILSDAAVMVSERLGLGFLERAA